METSRTRIACLLVPNLPLVAELRAHPELEGQPVAIGSGPGPRAEIIAASPEAMLYGVRLFTTVVQARAACAGLRVRVASPALERAARDALLDVALSTSPRAEAAPASSGLYAAEAAVYLDASGTSALFHSERGFAGALSTRARSIGLPACVSIASSRSIAHIAARHQARKAAERRPRSEAQPSEVQKTGTQARTGTQPRINSPARRPSEDHQERVIAREGEAAFLAALPIDLLAPEDALAQSLTRFGIHRIGDLARLPRRALLTRLGKSAEPLLALARGEQSDLPPSTLPETRLEEAIDLEAPVDRLESLAFVLRGLLSRLAQRLECRHLACGALDLQLQLEGGGRDARRVGVASPTLDTRVLLRLVCLSFEARPPPAAVETLRLATEGIAVRPEQRDFFRPAGPTPAVLSRTLAELEALCGPGRVGAPAVADSHRPDGYEMERFRPRVRGSLTRDGRDSRDAWDRDGEAVPSLAVRALRPPVPAQVRASRGHPESVRSAVANGDVVQSAGPWRTTGSWWAQEDRFAFDHFDILTSDGTLARLRFDQVQRTWQIDAIYD